MPFFYSPNSCLGVDLIRAGELVRARSNVHLADAKFERLNARVMLERMNMLVLHLIGDEDFICIKEVMPFIFPGHAPVLTTYLGPGRRTSPLVDPGPITCNRARRAAAL